MDFEGISGVAYSKTGELAISCKGDDVYLLDTRRAAASLNSEDRIFKSFNVPITHVPAKRYVGRKNVKTFLKGVAFMCDDEYVTTGGDDGNLYVWNKETCELVCKMQADSQVVNTVLPHPHLPTLVCCGIDNHVRVFEAGDGGVHLGTPPKRDENDMWFDDGDDEDEFADESGDDEDEDEDEDDDEDEGEGWTVEMGRADDGGVARWGDEARGERRGRARGERRGRARGVRVGDGDDRDRGRVRGAIGATEIGG